MRNHTKIFNILVGFAIFAFLLTSCAKEPIEKLSGRIPGSDIPTLSQGLGEIIEPPTTLVPQIVSQKDTMVQNGGVTVNCVATTYKWTAGNQELALYGDFNSFYLGEVFPYTAINTDWALVRGERREIPVSFSVNADQGFIVRDTIYPTLDDFRTFKQRVLSQNIGVATESVFSYQMKTFESLEEYRTKLGATASFPYGSIAGDIESARSSGQSLVSISFTQNAYSIDMNWVPDTDWGYEWIDWSSVGDQDPVEVRKIVMGRRGEIIFMSSATEAELAASVQAVFDAYKTNVQINWSLEKFKSAKESQIKVITVGGNPALAASATSIEGFMNFIEDGAVFGPDSPMAPIMLVLGNVRTGGIVKNISHGTYTTLDCEAVPVLDTITIDVPEITDLLFEKTGNGDSEFSDHGPKELVTVSLRITADEKLVCDVVGSVTECNQSGTPNGDYSKGILVGKTIELDLPGGDYELVKILSDTETVYVGPNGRIDDGHGENTYDAGVHECARWISVVGDTPGNDLSSNGTTCPDGSCARVSSAKLNPVQLVIRH